jgi:uncharacterized protein (TIGR03382 family)
LQTLAAACLTLGGLALMGIKIHADSEPGGIPILLVLLGAGWLGVVWRRNRTPPRKH